MQLSQPLRAGDIFKALGLKRLVMNPQLCSAAAAPTPQALPQPLPRLLPLFWGQDPHPGLGDAPGDL